jgi:hypothetical protein
MNILRGDLIAQTGEALVPAKNRKHVKDRR